MQVNIVGTANLKQAQSQFAALEGQVEALNRAMAKTSMVPAGGSVAGFQNQARALRSANTAYGQALAASGRFRVEQLKLNDVLDKQVGLMQRQKLSFREVYGKKNRGLMTAMRRDQLAMQQMASKTVTGGITDGKFRTTLAIPNEVHKSWDTLNQKVGFFGHQLASASGSLVNWGKNTQWAGRQMMAGLTMPIVAFGAAAGVMAYQVDKQMTRIQKVYDTTANQNSKSAKEQAAVEKEMAGIRADAYETSINAAKAYGASITDTLEVQAELAATGQKGLALQKNTTEVMRISMLGEIDKADTTKALIALQSTLGLSTKETTDAFNYMNAVENSTSLSMKDFAVAIPKAAAPIKAMGGDIKDLGLLLVAMRERGINAAEGANAIKAMMQRLYRPSKQIREEWVSLTKVDPFKIVTEEGGDIMKILPRISMALKGLDRASRVKALAGLFGTYQVTRMNAMLQGLDDMKDKTSQTYKAMQVAGNTEQQNAKIAAQETERQRKSASGQFRVQLQTLKAELAKIGDPFLNVATKFLQGFAMVSKAFNSIPDPTKKVLAWVAVFAAMFGPVVMLTGLLANFAGTGMKVVASMLKSASSFELLTKAQIGERIAAELTTEKFQQEATAAQVLTGNIMALNEAMNIHATEMARMQGLTPVATGIGNKSPAYWQSVGAMGGQSQYGTQMYNASMGSKAGAAPWTSVGVFQNNALPKGIKGDPRGGMNAKEMERAYATNAKLNAEMEKTSGQIAKNQERNSKFAAGAAASTAAMATSMIIMAKGSGETSQAIGEWMMMSAIMIPAIKEAGVLAKLLASRMLKAAAAEAALNAAAGTRGLGGAIKAAIAGFSAMMGPVGWITAGVSALVVGVIALEKHEQRITKEKLAQNAAVMQQKGLAEDALKISAKAYNTISTPSATNVAGQASAKDIAAEIKGTKGGKSLIAKMRDEDISATEKATIAQEGYAQVLNATGGTALKAQRYVEGLYMASGKSALQAQILAQNAYNSIGDFLDSDEQSKLWAELGAQSMDNWGLGATKRGHDIGKQMADAIASGADASVTLRKFGNDLDSKWGIILNNLSDTTTAALSNAGINTGAALKKAMDVWTGEQSKGRNPADALAKSFDISHDAAVRLGAALADTDMKHRGQIEAIRNVEKGTVQELATQLGITGKQLKALKTRNDLEATYNYQLLTATKKNAEDLYKLELARQKLKYGSPVTDEVKNMTMGFLTPSDSQIQETNTKKLKLAQMAAAAAGLEVVDTLSEQEMILKRAAMAADDTADGIGGAAGEAGKLKDALAGIPTYLRVAVEFDHKDMNTLNQTGMEGVVNDAAEALSAGFDERMSASLAATQASWDKRVAAAQAAGERASNALDNKWERIQNRFEKKWDRRKSGVEKYYDTRIKGIEAQVTAEEKAEEVRQKIFEAEQTRIQRLAQMANSTIDFNVALRTGSLDEAAKIRNDMEAQVSDWQLSDAAGASQDKSKARIDRLNNQKDNLDEARDKALKALDKREADEKASLDRREKREKASLARRTKANQDALQAQATAANNAAQRRWNMEKASYDRQLALLKAFIPRNKKELEAQMSALGLSYDKFGGALKAKGESWSKFFETSMVQHMREAGLKMASDNMWSGLGARNAREIARGMGFKNMNQFKKFIINGTVPDTFGKNLNKATSSKASNGVQNNNGTMTTAGGNVIQHGGGWAGQDSGRGGVARNIKGIHPSEVPILAKKGEYIVNADSAKQHAGMLESINRNPNSVANKGYGVGGGPLSGMAGLLLGAMGTGVARGVGVAMQKAAVAKRDQIDSLSGSYSGVFGSGKAGMYSDRSFSKAQLHNAAIIASVGSGMGMSKRDIEIGIMTAITESGLMNLHSGDRDSQGLFQQRPSQGWGTVAQVTDPQYSSRKFFSALRAVSNRGQMSPWQAAQAVQRSAYSDGSNYQQYWDNALAIYSKGLTKTSGGFKAATGGTGGWHKPSVPGKGWSNSHDYRNGPHSPLFAYNDGRIIESRAIRTGGSGQAAGAYPKGYSSYGVTVVVQGKDGNKVRYAHGWPGTNAPVGPVAGGAKIMESAATGNASGFHTHFEVNGAEIARDWFASHGIGLRKGGHVKRDGMANIHKGEAVISPKKTKTLYQSLATFGDIMNKVGRTMKQGISGPFGGLYPGTSATTSVGSVATATGTGATTGNSATGSTITGDGRAQARTGTFNAHTYGHSPTRTIGDLKKVLPHVDSLALQEWTGAAGSAKNWLLKQGWGIYKGPTGTAIAWNKAKYSASNFGHYDLNKKFKLPKGISHRYAVYGKLQDKQSGRKFWQASAHLIPGAGYKGFHGNVSTGQRNAILNEQYQRLGMLVNSLDNSAPVILGGDFNDRAKGKVKGLKSSSSGKNIDQIYSNLRALGAAGVLSTKGLASDHPFVYGKYNIPALSKGAMDVRFDNTLANLHAGEAVLTKDINSQFKQGMANFASGGNSEYNLKVELNGTNLDANDVANVVLGKIKAHEARKPVSRK